MACRFHLPATSNLIRQILRTNRPGSPGFAQDGTSLLLGTHLTLHSMASSLLQKHVNLPPLDSDLFNLQIQQPTACLTSRSIGYCNQPDSIRTRCAESWCGKLKVNQPHRSTSHHICLPTLMFWSYSNHGVTKTLRTCTTRIIRIRPPR